jgi:hypothetical protein
MQLRKWILVITVCTWWRLLQNQSIEKVESNTGIYFDEVGTIAFYPMKWKVVTYINLEPTREIWKQTKVHQRKEWNFVRKQKTKIGIITQIEWRLDNI